MQNDTFLPTQKALKKLFPYCRAKPVFAESLIFLFMNQNHKLISRNSRQIKNKTKYKEKRKSKSKFNQIYFFHWRQ
jgi:hypothetical protein